MPIRTTRGRAAAYRSVWQWPLRSPARLAVTAAVIVAVAALVGLGAGAVGGRAGSLPASTPTSAPLARSPSSYGGAFPSPTPTVLPPVNALAPSTLPVSRAPAAALDVARRWTVAWVRPPDGTAAATWLDGLRATTTDEYLGVLTGVDPSNIPATRVTGAPEAVQVAARSVLVDVPTDALTLVVTVVDTDSGGWKVSGYDRA